MNRYHYGVYPIFHFLLTITEKLLEQIDSRDNLSFLSEFLNLGFNGLAINIELTSPSRSIEDG